MKEPAVKILIVEDEKKTGEYLTKGLDLAHKGLDQAVAAAYDWPDYSADMPDEEILRRLLALNLERAAG